MSGGRGLFVGKDDSIFKEMENLVDEETKVIWRLGSKDQGSEAAFIP